MTALFAEAAACFQSSRIASSFLRPALPLKRYQGGGGGRVRDDAGLTGMAYAAPLADEAPGPEQIQLDVEPVVAVQVPRRITAAKGDSSHNDTCNASVGGKSANSHDSRKLSFRINVRTRPFPAPPHRTRSPTRCRSRSATRAASG
jgi:hypothetical protein